MKAKKGKDLVLELMGDLLGDDKKKPAPKTQGQEKNDSESIPPPQKGASSDTLVIPPATEGSQQNKDEHSKTVDPTKSELNFGTETADQKVVSKSANKKKKKIENPFAKKTAAPGGGSHVISRAQASLAQAENIRIAQQKIIDPKKEMDRLREENEALGAAGDTIRKRADELLVKAQKFEKRYIEANETAEKEKEILLDSLKSKDTEVQELNLKIDELETRLSSNIRKIRVRERELENRLELVKLEGAALVRNKDEIILDLKRQIDQINQEMENYRLKGQNLNSQLGKKEEILRRTVKALRLSLAMLEGSEIEQTPMKKVD